MNQEPIIFRQGEENGIVVERNNFEHSIMLNQYQQAINIFNRLWEQQSKSIAELKDKKRVNDIWVDNKFSNIIALCGDRGEGKSSCMASFATMLTDDGARKAACDAQRKILIEDKQTHEKKEEYQKLFNGLEDLLSTDKIEWLDVIDPSFFDDQHNLLELLLGRICIKAQEKCKQGCEREGSNAYKHRQLMEQLQRVRKCISVMAPKKDKPLYDAIEEISDLAAGMQLKTELQTLFRCYLDFVGKECLLICIDDLDLNIAEGYEMAEMLRKYLINPYCVILVSVKVEQLIDIIAAKHKQKVNGTDLDWDYCKQVAQKYVAKLLPRGNRVLMPVAEDFCERDLQIADVDGKINTEEPIYTVKEKVVQMIFQKTGYVFYNTQHLSPIIPRNLRSLRHLLGLLCTLPDARDENWDDDETGREAFKDYFFGTWATQNLSNRDYEFAQQLANYDDFPTMNAFVVEHFGKRVIDIDVHMDSTDINKEYEKLYRDITSNKNTSTNISYGDVMYVLWLISGITLNIEIQSLIFFIKTVYSMRLYACYNVISQNSNTLYPPTPNVDKEGHIHRAETLYANVNQLQRLINGAYFTYPQGTLLPSKDDNIFRDRTTLHVDKITPIVDGLFVNNSISLDNLRVCEYLALCVSRVTTSKEQNEDRGYNRTEKIPTYLGNLSTSANYFIFDFLQPFYSLTNIKYAYQRFDDILKENRHNLEHKSLFDIASVTEGSLYQQFLGLNKKLQDKSEWKKMHYLISDAIIRVADVQWAIYDELLRTRNLHKSGDDAVSQAYGDIQKLKIKLYHLIRKDTDDEDVSTLYFLFLNVLKTVWDKNENGECRAKLESVLYTSPMEVLSIEVADFATNISEAMRRILIWPIRGKELRSIISNASKLRKQQKSSFTRLLKHLFNDEESYQMEQVINRIHDITQQYLIAKSK